MSAPALSTCALRAAAWSVGPEAARAPGAQVSAPCRDLLARLLVADPSERMTMAEIKVHSWFLEDLPDGALAMNDWYLQSRPVHDQARRPRPRPAPPGLFAPGDQPRRHPRALIHAQ